MYSSYYRIIKYISFEPIHYTINLDVMSSLNYLTNLIIYFYIIYYEFELIKLSLFTKNDKRREKINTITSFKSLNS